MAFARPAAVNRFLVVLLIVVFARHAHADCSPSKVVVLFDRSTSMVQGTIDGVTKWAIATRAIEDVVGFYQDQAEFGLTVFPRSPRTCTGGAENLVAPELGILDELSAELEAAIPTERPSYWTPIGQSLEA